MSFDEFKVERVVAIYYFGVCIPVQRLLEIDEAPE
jgi:hypothetical protein